MSRLNRRSIQYVECAGINIATFLSDDRSSILVSASDLVDQLSLNVQDLESLPGVFQYEAYDSIGKQHIHQCIIHTDVNEFLWMHDCKESQAFNLIDFRKFFLYEVMTFWSRFSFAAASLSIRDALKVITIKTRDFCNESDIPTNGLYQMAVESLGYTKVPSRDTLPTEELTLISTIELLYASMVDQEMSYGSSMSEAIGVVDKRIREPLKTLGNYTRGLNNLTL